MPKDRRELAMPNATPTWSVEWNSWYGWAVPMADDLYDTNLAELRDEGLI